MTPSKKKKQNKKSIHRKVKPFVKKSRYIFIAFSLVYLLLAHFFGFEDAQPDIVNSFQQIEQKQALDIKQCKKQHYQKDEVSKPIMNDAEFIKQALNVEEDATDISYRLSSMVSQEISLEVEGIDNEIFANLPQIQPDDLTAADNEYSLYEEDLPQNIIIDDFWEKDHSQEEGYYVYDNHKNIKEIEVLVPHKPAYFGPQPVIAIVIDDMGINHRRTKDISLIQAPLTSSFLTYSSSLDSQIDISKRAGHEIMVHVPMEPKNRSNMSLDVLQIDMSEEQVKSGLEKMLSRFHEVKGVNNHMGSRFTENLEKMQYVMDVLKKHNLFFLDSKTSGKSVGKSVARSNDVDYANRHVFLDNVNEVDYILKQLALTEKIAKNNGYAIAIGHPKSNTVEALKLWVPSLNDKNIRLVHLSQIVEVLNR